MVFRQKKGKGQANNDGKKKLKRNFNELPREVSPSPLNRRTQSAECKVTKSNPGKPVSAGPLPAGDVAENIERGERRQPLRKCRLSLDIGIPVTPPPTKHKKNVNKNSYKNVGGVGLKIDQNEGISDSPSFGDDPIVSQLVDSNEKDCHAREYLLGVEVNKNSIESSQVTHNMSKEKFTNPDEDILNESGKNVSPIKKKVEKEVPYNSSTVVLHSHGSVPKRMYDELNLRKLRVVVTRTEFPLIIPEKKEKMRHCGNENASCVAQKAKSRVARVSSPNSNSSVEDSVSSECAPLSDEEKDNIISKGNIYGKDIFPVVTLNRLKELVPIPKKNGKAVKRIIRRVSESSNESESSSKSFGETSDVERSYFHPEKNDVKSKCIVAKNTGHRRKVVSACQRNKNLVKKICHNESIGHGRNKVKNKSTGLVDVSRDTVSTERICDSVRIHSSDGNPVLSSDGCKSAAEQIIGHSNGNSTVSSSTSDRYLGPFSGAGNRECQVKRPEKRAKYRIMSNGDSDAGEQMFNSLNRNSTVSSVTSSRIEENFSGPDDCEDTIKRPGKRAKYRIMSDGDSDENSDLSSNVTGSSEMAMENTIVTLEKSNNMRLCNSVGRNYGFSITTGGICTSTLPTTSSNSTQTTFDLMNSEVNLKGRSNPEKKNIGVQKDREVKCQMTQTKFITEFLLPEAMAEKCQALDVGLINNAASLPNLMLALLDQLKSAKNSTTNSMNQAWKARIPSGSVKEASSKGKYSLKTDRSDQSMHGCEDHRANITDQILSNDSEIRLGLNNPQHISEMPEVTSESGGKELIVQEKIIDLPCSSKSNDKFSSFFKTLDILPKSSSNKVSKGERERKLSKVCPESKQEDSIVSQMHGQLSLRESGCNKLARKSISASKRRKSSSGKSSSSSKVEKKHSGPLIASSRSTDLIPQTDECGSEEHKKSSVMSFKAVGESISFTSVPAKDSKEKDKLNWKKDTEMGMENGVSNSETDSDLSVAWQSISKKVTKVIRKSKLSGKINRSPKNETSGNMANVKSIEVQRVSKSNLSVMESDNSETRCIFRTDSMETNTLDGAAELNPIHPEINSFTCKERINLTKQKSSRLPEMTEIASTSDSSQDKAFGNELEQDIQHLSEVNCNTGDESDFSLTVCADEDVVKVEGGDSHSDDDADCDVISIYGESEYAVMLNGMSFQQGRSDEMDFEEPSSCKSLMEKELDERDCDNTSIPSPSIVDEDMDANASGLPYSCETATLSKANEVTLGDSVPVNNISSSPEKEHSKVDNNSEHSKVDNTSEHSKVDNNSSTHPETSVPNSILGDSILTCANFPALNSPCKDQETYFDLKKNTWSLTPVTQTDYRLLAPPNIRAFQDDVDKKWRRKTSLFKGMCFLFLKNGHCSCSRFKHKFMPNFMQHIEKMSSWDIFVNLRFALLRKFTSFWNKFGSKMMKIFESRKEGNLLLAIWFSFISMKTTTLEWTEILDSINDCGNCDESNVQQILLFLIINHLHKGKVLNIRSYNIMVDKVASMCCKIKKTQLLCEILGVLGRQDFWFSKSTFEKLLQRCLAESSTEVGLELCFTFGMVVDRMSNLSHADPSVLNLMKKLVIVLQTTNNVLANSIRGKIKEINPCYAQVNNKGNPALEGHVQQIENVISDNLLGVEENVHDTLGDGPGMIRHVPFKSRNSESVEGLPSRKSLISNPEGNSMNPVSGCKHSDLQSQVLNEIEPGNSLPHSECFVPQTHNLALVNDLMPDKQRLVSNCSSNVANLPNSDKENALSKNSEISSLLESPCPSPSSDSDGTEISSSFENQLDSDSSANAPAVESSVCVEANAEFADGKQIDMYVDKVTPVENKTDLLRGSVEEDQYSMQASFPLDECGTDQSRVDFSSDDDEEAVLGNSDDPDLSNPAPETMKPPSSNQLTTYAEEYKKKYNCSAFPKSLRELQNSNKDITLEEVIKKRQWTPSLMLKFFHPCLTSAEVEENLVLTILNLLQKDWLAALPMVKALVNYLESNVFIELMSYPEYTLMKKAISTLVFNVMLKMIMSEEWQDAFNLLSIANDASLPLISSEGFIEEKMSQTRKLLFLSEICFRVDKMKEAIYFLRQGDLFKPAPIQWAYDSFDADFEIFFHKQIKS
ncbi:uncharacterized protein [Hetaerina americana]|uniref:uncharacterized protein isoform X2 n=1 Tax=Hetaerina americana TaxID=62018 RepID=UPI003A7F5BF8